MLKTMTNSLKKSATEAASKASAAAKSASAQASSVAKSASDQASSVAKSASKQASSASSLASASSASVAQNAVAAAKSAKASASKNATALKNAAARTGTAAVNRMDDGRKYVDQIEVFQKFNPVIWILIFNAALRLIMYFSSNVGKTKQNKLKKKYTKRHLKETFGVALISLMIVWYLTFMFDSDNVTPQSLRDGLFLSLYLNVFLYDYISSFTSLINVKYFKQNKKAGAKLGGIYFGIVIGMLAFFAVMIGMLYYIQVRFLPNHYNMFGEEFDVLAPIAICACMFIITFIVSIPNFFLVNPDLQKTKKKYKSNMKQFYMDSFKQFFIVYLAMYLLILMTMNLNITSVDKVMKMFGGAKMTTI